MRVPTDERGRVPFALVGALLLVASATAAGAIAGQDPAPARTRTDRVADRVETGANVAVAGAARDALRAAARSPVVSAGNSTYGAVLDPDRPFRDALALRVYARAERTLRNVTARSGDYRATATLPRVRSPADARRALDAVAVERVNDSVARVTVGGVRVELRRDGRVVDRRTRNVSVTVRSAALSLHDRVQRFEGLLHRDAFDGPGLDRRVTALLHAVVWTRGPLQYGGLPISNVLANRHVELATNHALLGLQRAAFGRADAAGQTAARRALGRVGLRDVVAGLRSAGTARTKALLARGGVPDGAADIGVSSALSGASSMGSASTVPYGVDVTADRAFVAFLDDDGTHSLNATLRAAYDALATRTVDVEPVSESTTRDGDVPENWTLVDAERETETRVLGDATARATLSPGERSLASFARHVRVTERTTRRYANATRERSVTTTHTRTLRVSVTLGFRLLRPTRPKPTPRTETALDEPVRSMSPEVREAIEARATRRLLAEPGGVDALARRAVEGDVVDRTIRVRPPVPQRVGDRAYRAARRLREDARNVSANVSTADLASGRVPGATLRERLAALDGVQDGYESVAARAVDAARATYLGRVDARLRDRQSDGTLAAMGRRFGERGVEATPDGAAARVDPGSVAAVDGAPAYLTLGRVTPDVSPDVDAAYYTLVARNVNWVTVPGGDVADALLPGGDGGETTVGLGRAAQALTAAERALDAAPDNATLRGRRDALRSAVETGVSDAAVAYRGVLHAANVSFGERERHAITRAAFERWPSAASRAKAVENGSMARAVAAEAAATAGLSGRRRDRLATRLRAAAPDVSDRSGVRVDVDLVRQVAETARSAATVVAKESLSHAVGVSAERAARLAGVPDLGAVPAGIPVTPVPGFWYATANAWSVDVRGSWQSFAVQARGGSPVGPGDGLTYRREDAPVTFDVDGDGSAERVGRNERLSFDVHATVFVVVPAGPRGVGDVDGNRDERSPGWREQA